MPEPREPFSCTECGEHYTPRTRTHRFCTPICQRREEKRRHRSEKRHYVWRTCSQCGVRYHGAPSTRSRATWAHYCSSECQAEAKAWTYRKALSTPCPLASCLRCHTPYVARTRCPRCRPRTAPAPPIPLGPCLNLEARPKTRRWYMGHCIRCGEGFTTDQPAQRTCSRPCARRESKSRRRATKRKAFIEPVYRHKVYERDDWTCQLCHQPVDQDAEVPHPQAATLDHIVPLALGGDHSHANTQCAHFICNCLKSHQLEGQLHFAA